MRIILRFGIVMILVFAFFVTGCIQIVAPDAQPTAVPAETEPAKEPAAETPAP